MYNEDYLQHYGVPGMKWRHKKAQPIISPIRKKNRGYSNDRDGQTPDHKLKGPVMSGPKKKNDILTPYQQERKRQEQHIARKRAITVGTNYVNSYLASKGKNMRLDNLEHLVKYALDRNYMNNTFK